MRTSLLIAVASAALAGCAVEPLSLEREVTYIVEWVGEEPVVGRNPISITFSDDRAYGNAGCNHWFAGYQLEGQQLHFDSIGSTRKACAEHLMRQERHFLERLSQVERWDVSNIDQLRLWPVDGAAIRAWPEQN